MKYPIPLTYFIIFTLFSCTTRQSSQVRDNNQFNFDTTKIMDKFEFSLKTAHPHAQALMPEDFYWSPIEETAPFGSDDGSDAAYGFREWRLTNKSLSPIIYLKELIERWQYPYFDWNEMDTTKIKEYIVSSANIDEASIQQQMEQLKNAMKNSADSSFHNIDETLLRQAVISSSQEMGGSSLLGQDNAIIGTGFAQFALEGKIDNNLKALTITAINRQLLPVLINRYDEDYQNKRKQQLTKMLGVINNANPE